MFITRREMTHKMYDEIVNELSGIDSGDILKIVLSTPKQGIQKANIRPVLLQNEKKWQIEKIINNQAFHLNIMYGELPRHFAALLEEFAFRHINFVLKGRTIAYTITKKKKFFRNESKTAAEAAAVITHDKQKKYILEEGMPIQPLVDLGVFDNSFRVIKSKYDKFRQINRFVEIIADEFENYDSGEKFTVIDFGCGKSYLTFILYYYFREIKGIDVNITGYDLKSDVVAHCNTIAKKYAYKNLRFITGDVSNLTGCGKTDMIITLHACDTATDYALAFAVKNKVRYIFSVPCCQHEVNAQIANNGEFSILLRHGLYKERFSALLTDAIRCEVLSNQGYNVDVLEFVDFENTPKNAMIRATLTGRPPAAEINTRLEKLTAEFTIKPTILKLINSAAIPITGY